MSIEITSECKKLGLKKVETLFHTTTTIENLENIIDSNFQVSYSREIFKRRETLIPMVSFSNVLLFETKSQINYGDYSIGLTKEWGIKNKLHPVSYTYDDSDYENSIQHLSHMGEVGKLLDVFHVYRHFSKITLKENPEYEPIFEKLLANLDEKGRKAVIDFFEKAHPTFVGYELFTKKITASNKAGQTFECFNDREWRYLPEDVIETFRYVPLKKEESEEEHQQNIVEFDTFINEKKKHYENKRLGFDLEDIKFIIVKETGETEKIFNALYEKYSKDKVLKRIEKGNLLVSSYELIFNNF